MPVRVNAVAGSLTEPMGPTSTTMVSEGLIDLPAISGDFARVTVYRRNPAGRVTAREVVHVTAHESGAMTATVQRAREGTTAGDWVAGDRWDHATTAADLNGMQPLLTPAIAPAVRDILDVWSRTEGETKSGAQARANAARDQANAYTDAEVQALILAQGLTWGDPREWDAGATYPPLRQVVASDGAYYVSLRETTGEDPTDPQGTAWSAVPTTIDADFRQDANDPATGFVRKPDADAAYRQVTVSVAQHGADPTGAVGIKQAVHDAVAAVPVGAHGTIVFPDGLYRVADYPDIQGRSNLTFLFMPGAVLKPDADVLFSLLVRGQPEDRISDIKIIGLTVDGSNNAPGGAEPGTGFAACRVNFADRVQILDTTYLGGHDGIILRGVDWFRVAGMLCRDMTESMVTLFAETKNGTITGLVGEDVEEVVDFFDNDNILVDDVVAWGGDSVADEAFDYSSSRNCHITNCLLTGFYRVVHAKTEVGIASSDLRVSHIQAFEFGHWALLVSDANTRFTAEDCTFITTKPNVVAVQAAGAQTTLRRLHIETTGQGINHSGANRPVVEDCYVVSTGDEAIVLPQGVGTRKGGIVRRNRAKAANAGAGLGAYRVNAMADLIFEYNEVIDNTGNGIRIISCRDPRVLGNVVRTCGRDGLYVEFNTEASLDDVNKIIGAVIVDNEVINHGHTTASRSGIIVTVNWSGASGTYRLLRITGNTVRLTDTAVVNGQAGILLQKAAGVTALSEAIYTENAVLNTPATAKHTVAPLTDSTILNNVGLKNRASGTATITDGQTNFSVTHGLAAAPTRVLVTPRVNALLWVTDRFAASFRVVRSGTTGDVQFDWYAES